VFENLISFYISAMSSEMQRGNRFLQGTHSHNFIHDIFYGLCLITSIFIDFDLNALFKSKFNNIKMLKLIKKK